MRTTFTACINTVIARMAILCLLFSLYTNFALSQETVTDVDGNVYQTVDINGQVWTLSNYRVTKYADGTLIPSGLSNAEWATDTAGACAIPPTGNDSKYGLLYNGYAVRNTTHGGIAIPAGWRIATDQDWQALEAYLGMTPADLNISNWRASGLVGQKLKSTTVDWTSHVNGGTDDVGYKALPAGTRGTNGTFTNANQQAAFWTPIEGIETDPNYTNRRALNYNRMDIHRADLNKRNGLSIRLVKIPPETVTDIDGNVYQTVTINGKVWTLSNYRVTRYADGTCITSGLTNAEWAVDTAGACATPPTGDANISGLLYNGFAVRNTSHGGIAVPTGWRIATDEDWQDLEAYLGMTLADLVISNWRASGSVGQKLKSTTTDWQAHANAGTDAVGFKALPTGTRASNGTLSGTNQRAAYWTPSEDTNANPDKTYRRVIDYNRQDIHRTALAHIEGMSIRLVKIMTTPPVPISYNSKQNFNSFTPSSWETVSATVVPNPVVAGASITLSLTGYQGKMLTARLIKLDGTVVQKWSDIVADNSQSGYLLGLSTKLVTGQYILHVQGNGFSQSVKLIVQ